jgi:hypothetical protein
MLIIFGNNNTLFLLSLLHQHNRHNLLKTTVDIPNRQLSTSKPMVAQSSTTFSTPVLPEACKQSIQAIDLSEFGTATFVSELEGGSHLYKINDTAGNKFLLTVRSDGSIIPGLVEQ